MAETVFWSIALDEGPQWVEMNLVMVPEQDDPGDKIDGGYSVREPSEGDYTALLDIEAEDHRVEGQVAEVAQRGLALAEVVEGEADAPLPHRGEQLDEVGAERDHVLGDLEEEPGGVDAGLAQDLGDARDAAAVEGVVGLTPVVVEVVPRMRAAVRFGSVHWKLAFALICGSACART